MAIAKGQNYLGPPLVTAAVDGISVETLRLNLETAGIAMVQRAADWAVGAGVDILAYAIPMTPVKTGKLRKSGTVTIDFGTKKVDVARGLKRGDVRLLAGIKEISPTLSKKIAKRAKGITTIVHFRRHADSNQGPRDIAIWTHEMINPHGSGTPPSARTPGTGPKYLEKAYNQRKGHWKQQAKLIQQQIARDVEDMSVKSGRAGPFSFQRIKLKLARLKQFVFFKRR